MTLPKDIADEIKFFSNMGKRRGWGSVKVDVSIGNTSWNTSIFPNDGDYILPVKANVRKAESLINGKMVSVKLTANFPV